MTDTNPPEGSSDQPFPIGSSPYDQGPYSVPTPADPEPLPPMPAVPPALLGEAPTGAPTGAPTDAYGTATTSPFGSWSPFDQYATAPVPPAQPFDSPTPGSAEPARPRTGRTVALVLATALVAGAVGGGIGATITSGSNDNATPSSLASTSTTAPVKVNLPAGSVEAVAAKVLPSVVSIIERA